MRLGKPHYNPGLKGEPKENQLLFSKVTSITSPVSPVLLFKSYQFLAGHSPSLPHSLPPSLPLSIITFEALSVSYCTIGLKL
jgi:hypothetical protein